VFRAAQKAGFSGKAQLEHVGYGTMNGLDGKPFKTRAGGAMKLYDLIAMAKAEAEKRLAEQGIGAEFSAEERSEIARKVGIGGSETTASAPPATKPKAEKPKAEAPVKAPASFGNVSSGTTGN